MNTLSRPLDSRRTATDVVQQLIERGDLWVASPGFVGMRGATAGLFRAIERIAGEVGGRLGPEVWRTPAVVPFETLDRADYFASFPQWLSGLSHLSDDPVDLARVASHSSPAKIAHERMVPQPAALPPAVCYHTYAVLAEKTLSRPVLMTAQGTCWRNEESGFQPLVRGWAFTMREAVCVGEPEVVEQFRLRATQSLRDLALRLDLTAELHPASDPFFASTAEERARGKALLQRIRELKHELQVDLGGRRALAIGSVNHHASFFGEAFDISLPNGGPAHSACVAFGLERWVLAVMLAHGTEPQGWPEAIHLYLDGGSP